MEKFAARVLKGGKVTIPKRLRELLKIEDGVYARAFSLIDYNSKKGAIMNVDVRRKGNSVFALEFLDKI